MNNYYLPEGAYISTVENSEYVSCLASLERAMHEERIIEGVALKCDNDLRLTVELGNYIGYIDREDAVFTYDNEPVKDIAVITRVGKPVCFKIKSMVRLNNGEMEIKLSRREAQHECIENKLSKLRAGDIISAKVTHLEQFGAFVDIGCGVISLLSIDCISVSRISHPKDRFSVGDSIRCIVKKNEDLGRRIYVSHKELLGTWEENVSEFSIGQTVTGIVRSVEDYGIFVELAPNLAGLAEYKEDVRVGKCAAVFIKNIIPERMKIKLILIDANSPCTSAMPERYKYYIDEDVNHLDDWLYSPKISEKIVETQFC